MDCSSIQSGVSPDSTICCLCCENDAIEIKSPYCHRGEAINSATASDRKFCLKETDGKLHLDTDHTYYYKIQIQLFVCDAEYCDFCVCTFAEPGGESAMHIERIHKAVNSGQTVEKAKWLFRTCLLPEPMGSWLTHPFVVDSSEVHSAQAHEDSAVCQGSNSQLDTLPTYSYCGDPEFGRMLACDNKDCLIEWFHIECIKLE